MENNENLKNLSNPISYTKYLEKNAVFESVGNWKIKNADKIPLLDSINSEINQILSSKEQKNNK